MIWCYSLKVTFVRNFHDKIKCCISLIVLAMLKDGCDIKTSQILSFFSLKNNLVTIGPFLIDSISAIISSNTINTLVFFVGL